MRTSLNRVIISFKFTPTNTDYYITDCAMFRCSQHYVKRKKKLCSKFMFSFITRHFFIRLFRTLNILLFFRIIFVNRQLPLFNNVLMYFIIVGIIGNASKIILKCFIDICEIYSNIFSTIFTLFRFIVVKTKSIDISVAFTFEMWWELRITFTYVPSA